MKTRLFEQLKHLYGMLGEKILERYAQFCNMFRRESNAAGNLCETYSIKREYANKRYICDFISERTRIAAYNGYRIIFDNAFTSDVKEEIGRVTLTCRGRYIEHATLIAGEPTGNGNRLIYWKFN